MAFNAAPLPHEYMITGIIGFFVSVFFIYDISKTWGFALGVFCLLLVIASIVSVETTRIDDDALDLIAGEPYQSKKRKTLADRKR